jgi:hypothetical protein
LNARCQVIIKGREEGGTNLSARSGGLGDLCKSNTEGRKEKLEEKVIQHSKAPLNKDLNDVVKRDEGGPLYTESFHRLSGPE